MPVGHVGDRTSHAVQWGRLATCRTPGEVVVICADDHVCSVDAVHGCAVASVREAREELAVQPATHDVREQAEKPSALNGNGQFPLILGRDSGFTPCFDSSAICYEPA